MATNLEFLRSCWLRLRCGRASSLMAVVIVLACCQAASAERKEAAPEPLLDVGVEEHLNDLLPLDAQFTDTNGKPVKLGDCFDGELPVILTMNYSNCPMLCSLQLDGLFEGLKSMEKWSLGKQYRMVTISIDPLESTERSAMTREKYLKLYRREGSGEGYTCLTGKNTEIKRVADAAGFKYRYVPETGEYLHAAVTMICTPEGRLSRYLDDVVFDQQTLRLSLLEASQGKIGNPMDQLLLFCFQYDSTTGKYAPAAVKLMKFGAISIVLVVGGVLIVYWRRESRRVRSEETVDSQ